MQVAEYPQRKCRIAFTEDGLIDHACDVIETHPGPCAALSSAASVKRRDEWEAANPGWERMMASTDPFEEISPHIPEEQHDRT